jgi:hypothetical protein
MVYFQTKNPNLGKFCRAAEWKMFIYFAAIWNIFSGFGIMHQEKSGMATLKSIQLKN